MKTKISRSLIISGVMGCLLVSQAYAFDLGGLVKGVSDAISQKDSDNFANDEQKRRQQEEQRALEENDRGAKNAKAFLEEQRKKQDRMIEERAREDKARRDEAQAQEQAQQEEQKKQSAAKWIADMQASYDLRRRPELASSFDACLKNERQFESSYIKFLEQYAQQATTVSEKNGLLARAADWKKNLVSTVPAMCLDRMNFAFRLMGNGASADIAANLTPKGFEPVRRNLSIKPGMFYMLSMNPTAFLGYLMPDTLNTAGVNPSEVAKIKGEIKRIEGNADSVEAYEMFATYVQKNAQVVIPFISGTIH